MAKGGHMRAELLTLESIGAEADPKTRLNRMRALVDSVRAAPADTPSRAAVLRRTQSLLRETKAASQSDKAVADDAHKLLLEVQGMIRKDYLFSGEHLAAEGEALRDGAAEIAAAAPDGGKMLHTFDKQDLVTQGLAVGTIAVAASTAYGLVRNRAVAPEQRTGILGWLKRTKDTLITAVAGWAIWRLFRASGTGGTGAEGKFGRPNAGPPVVPTEKRRSDDPVTAPAAPKASSDAEPASVPKDVWVITTKEDPKTGKKFPLWNVDMRVLRYDDVRADPLINEQRRYENARTGERYSIPELAARLKAVKKAYVALHPDHPMPGLGIQVTLDVGPGNIPVHWYSEGAWRKGLGTSGVLIESPPLPSQVKTTKDEDVASEHSRTGNLQMWDEEALSYKGVQYVSAGRYERQLRAVQEDAGDTEKYDWGKGTLQRKIDEYKEGNKLITEMPQIPGAIELRTRYYAKPLLTPAQLKAKLKSPDLCTCEIIYPRVKVLGPGTDPKADGSAFLQVEGERGLLTEEQFRAKLDTIKSDYAPIKVKLRLVFDRARGSADGAAYKKLIDDLQDQGNIVAL